MSEVNIRQATSKDAAVLAELGALTFTHTFGHLYDPKDLHDYIAGTYTIEKHLIALSDPYESMWLLEDGKGQALAFGWVGACKLPVPSNVKTNAGEVKRIYVHPDHQGKKLGSVMIEKMLAWLVDAGYDDIYVGVWSENYGAQRLYGRYGFEKFSEYEFPVGDHIDREFIFKQVQEIALQYVSQPDLTRCARVSRDWNRLCTPALWMTVTITDGHSLHLFKSLEARGAIAKHSRHIRSLRTSFLGVLKLLTTSPSSAAADDDMVPLDGFGWIAATPRCQNLTIFEIEGVLDLDDPPFPTVMPNVSLYNNRKRSVMTLPEQALVLNFIKSNRNLHHLHLPSVFDQLEKLFSVLSSNHLPFLQHLQLSYFMVPAALPIHKVHPFAARQFFRNISPHIRRLFINLDMEQTDAKPTVDLTPCEDHSLLEQFIFHGSFAGAEEYVLLPLLQSCSHRLHRIVTPSCVHRSNESLCQVAMRLGAISNEILALDPFSNLSDSSLAAMVNQSSTWKNISFHKQEFCGDITAAAIAAQCQELEELTLSECNNISSAALHNILCRTTELKKLNVSYTSYKRSISNPQLDAVDAISSPWACRGLKEWYLDVVGVPRPDIKFGHDGDVVEGPLHTGTVQDSHSIQRRILGQLGAMTELETLYLGCFTINLEDERNFATTFEDLGVLIDADSGGGGNVDVGYATVERYVHHDFQLQCLEMSLASGLELLSELKNLREMSLAKMAHRIGVPELEWMLLNWPKLERVHGLFDDWYPTLEPGVREWLFAKKPKWGEMYLHPMFQYNESRTCGGYYRGFTKHQSYC
ncbi:hypothetical protein BG004_003869 [Podila humilis]|nr:hypothetical protein BG004_003869 [Podila humilis]